MTFCRCILDTITVNDLCCVCKRPKAPRRLLDLSPAPIPIPDEVRDATRWLNDPRPLLAADLIAGTMPPEATVDLRLRRDEHGEVAATLQAVHRYWRVDTKLVDEDSTGPRRWLLVAMPEIAIPA